jgi:hypothetical protein
MRRSNKRIVRKNSHAADNMKNGLVHEEVKTMYSIRKRIGFGALLAAVGCLVALTGCPPFLSNLTEEKSGSVSLIIINNTPYRASFTLGGYDAWVLNPPGEVEIKQLALEANLTENGVTLECARNVAIGTDAMAERIVLTEQNLGSTFNQDLFSANVNFSSAPADSDAANLPTEGTAAGLEVRLGVDFACTDQLIFTFEENETPVNGHRFRIDYELLHMATDN